MSRTNRAIASSLFAVMLLALGLWVGAVAFAPPPQVLAPGRTADTSSAPDAELERLRERIAELEGRLARRQRPRMVRPEPVVARVVKPPAPSVPSRAHSAVTRAWIAQLTDAWAKDAQSPADGRTPVVPPVERAQPQAPEKVDLATLTDEQLLAHARAQGKSTRSQLIEARDAWTELVARNPGPELLDPALFGLGLAHRNLGSHDTEKETFEQLAEFAGPTTARGQEARYQLAWAHYYDGEKAVAADLMDAVARDSNDATERARHSLLNGASFARSAGSTAQARDMYERLIRQVEHETDGLSLFFDEHARAGLKRLE